MKIAREIVTLLSMAALSGCASRSSIAAAYMHPERFYLQDKPYSRLHVEIDRTKGVDLPPFLVDELKAFLGEHCAKPDGIEVVLDPPIPACEFENMPRSAASILYTDGPPPDDDAQPAYLHIVAHDGKTAFRGARREPHVLFTCPSTIFWNVDYARSWPDQARIDTLRHELGHILGLCRNTDHGDGAHCDKHGCLMFPTPDLLSQIGGRVHLYYREQRLCDDCLRDLKQAAEAPCEQVLSFAGLFLIRKEDGYSVASLAFCELIVPHPMPAEFDWQEALGRAKAYLGKAVGPVRREEGDLKRHHEGAFAAFLGAPQTADLTEMLEQDIAALSRATNDPSAGVRRLPHAEEATRGTGRASKMMLWLDGAVTVRVSSLQRGQHEPRCGHGESGA